MDRRRFLTDGLTVPALMLAVPGAADLSTGRRTRRAPREASDERFEAVSELVQEKMTEFGVPGVALGVVKDGETLMRGFGITNVEDPTFVTPDTIFPLASLSKTVAATAMMRLVEQGRVDLDAPVRTYVSAFRVQDEAASRAVTIRHLLTHTPGWEGQLGLEDRGQRSLEYFAESTMAELPQISAPGSVWSYNNAGFALAGRVLEVVTGRDIDAALRELVFAPLGLTRAFTRMGDIVTYPFAQGHRPAPGGDGSQVVRPFVLGSSVTAGGVAMSLTDVMAYARFHLGARAASGESLLSADTLRAMRTVQFAKEPTGDGISLGWHVRPVGAVTTFSHGGTAGAGHRLLLALVPERDLAFAVLTNHTEAWRLVESVERALLGVYERAALAPNQAICHRGINEAMTSHASPLEVQPDPRPYLGTYLRPPLAAVQVSEEGGALIVGAVDGAASAGTRLVFYGPDLAYAASGSGAYVGSPYEFIRTAGGEVGWIRVNGRVARMDGRG